MRTAVLILPILPDREEPWRRFAQELSRDRLGEYEISHVARLTPTFV